MDILAYDFMRQAIYAGLLASLLCGVVGTFVVVKRLVFVSGGISHAAFGGLGLCYFLGVEPLLGAAATAVLAAILLTGTSRDRTRSADATIGIMWAVGMAAGIVLIARTPGYAPNLMTYLFGNILTVDATDVAVTLAFTAFVVAFAVLFFKEFVAVSFDEEFAAVQGVKVRPLMGLLMVLVALSVVLLIRLVGVLLAIALLTIPPVIALRLSRSFLSVIALSCLLGALMTLGGLAISYVFDLPSGPVIVLLGAALLLLVRLAARAKVT